MRKVISQFGEGPLQQGLAAGDIHFLSDAEVSKGGSGTGPSPHEYLGAALVACTSMTLKMYTGRKGMGLENAIVTVDIERVNDIEMFAQDIQLQRNLSSEAFPCVYLLLVKMVWRRRLFLPSSSL